MVDYSTMYFDFVKKIEIATPEEMEEILLDKNYISHPYVRPYTLHNTNYETTKYLVEEKGFAIENEDNIGETPVFHAKGEKLKYLISLGANVNKINSYGENPLFSNTYKESLAMLIEAGADIHKINQFGNNILWYLTKEQIETVLKYGEPNFYQVSNENQNLLFIADMETIDLFISKGVDPFLIDNEGNNILLHIVNKEFNYNDNEFEPLLAKFLYMGLSPYHKNNKGECAWDNFSDELKEKYEKEILSLFNQKDLYDIINPEEKKIKPRM